LLLLDRTLGPIIAGRLSVGVALWIHAVVAATMTFDLTESTVAVSVVTGALFVPMLLTPWAGSWADRGALRTQLLIGRLLCVLGSLVAAMWSFIGAQGDGSWASVWPLMAGSTLLGCGMTVGAPALDSLTPKVVTPAELASALALSAAPMTFGRVAAPPIAAAVVGLAGPTAGFLTALALQMAFGLVLSLVPLPDDGWDRATDSSVAAGIRYLADNRALVLLLVCVGAAGAGAEPSITMSPALTAAMGGGPDLLLALTSAFGFGALIGLVASATFASYVNHRLVACGALWAMSLGSVLAGVGTTVAATVAGMATLGLGFTAAIASLSTLVQQTVESHYRGRVMALWSLCFMGVRPVASGGLGFASDTLGPRWAMTLMAVLLALATIVALPRRGDRTCRAEARPRACPPNPLDRAPHKGGL
jgi:MFS family permease